MFVTKLLERQDARRLRAEGMPYEKIATTLGVSVGSAYLWTSDIELTPRAIQEYADFDEPAWLD
jgi:transposase